jgi:glucose/arabinose dehydrogenase
MATLASCAPSPGEAPRGAAGRTEGDLPSVRMVEAFPNLRFQRPVDIAHAGDGSGRFFLVEQAGRIHVFAGTAEVTTTDVFLDIRSRVRSYSSGGHNEEGLLAIAFHPSYPTNGQFFIWYTTSRPLRNVLSRFRVSADNPNRADPASETVLLESPKPYGNHNGATLVFGPDGYLYVSIGDGGSAGDPQGNGQKLSTILAKILRIDVDREENGRPYAIPPDNPFVGRAGARGEIWAYGLRNVWRMSFDRQTGELWAGDVGQDRWEEVDLIVKGGNYGWNIREGFHRFRGDSREGLIEPVTEYGRPDGASVTGGFVYRGNRLPRLRGAYVYADYVTGRFWALRYRDGAVAMQKEILRQPKNIISFAEDPDAELLILADDGKIYRFEEVTTAE